MEGCAIKRTRRQDVVVVGGEQEMSTHNRDGIYYARDRVHYTLSDISQIPIKTPLTAVASHCGRSGSLQWGTVKCNGLLPVSNQPPCCNKSN